MTKLRMIDRCSGTALAAALVLGLSASATLAEGNKAQRSQSQQSSQQSQQSHSMGLQGVEIREVQTELTELGYDVGGVDGQWGDKTASAVREFQEDQGLSVSGNPDQETLQALGIIEDRATPSGASSTTPNSDLPARGGVPAGQPGSSGSGSGGADMGTSGAGGANK